MIYETRRKMRSRLIVRYYSTITVADKAADTVTGILYAVTDQGNEVPVYQTGDEPVTRDAFMTEVAKLETALNETWYTLPIEVIDDGQE